MRTTLNIDDDMLAAARAIALQEGKSLGDVVSGLARHTLRRPRSAASRNDIPLLPVSNPQPLTLETVNALRDGP